VCCLGCLVAVGEAPGLFGAVLEAGGRSTRSFSRSVLGSEGAGEGALGVAGVNDKLDGRIGRVWWWCSSRTLGETVRPADRGDGCACVVSAAHGGEVQQSRGRLESFQDNHLRARLREALEFLVQRMGCERLDM
jgi:hypothetical protein